jgi:hypothetical protein
MGYAVIEVGEQRFIPLVRRRLAKLRRPMAQLDTAAAYGACLTQLQPRRALEPHSQDGQGLLRAIGARLVSNSVPVGFGPVWPLLAESRHRAR